MKLSDNALKFLEVWEGISLEVYRDAGGKPTIGIGHLLTPQELSSGFIHLGMKSDHGLAWRDGITEKEARELKLQDAERFESAVNGLGVNLEQHEFDALVILAFNIGVSAFLGSSVAERTKQGDYSSAMCWWAKWNKVNRKPSKGLSKRRAAEIAMFSSADYSGEP